MTQGAPAWARPHSLTDVLIMGLCIAKQQPHALQGGQKVVAVLLAGALDGPAAQAQRAAATLLQQPTHKGQERLR